MQQIITALQWLWDNKTKVIGYAQVTFGVLATGGDLFGPKTLKGFVLASGLLTAWIGHYNTMKKTAQPAETPPAPPVLSWLSFFLLWTLFSFATPWAHAAVGKTSEGPWYLVVSSSPQYPAATSLADCQAKRQARIAADAKTKTSGTRSYYCRQGNTVTFVANPPPPPPPSTTLKVWNCDGADGRSLEPWPNCSAPVFRTPEESTVVASNTSGNVRWLSVAKLQSTTRVWTSDNTWTGGIKFPAPPPATTVRAATLRWTAPTQNTDGSALANLAGYRIYYGKSASALSQSVQVSNPATTSYVVSNLDTGTYYFAVRAYTSTGAESANSNVASKTIQ